MRIVTRPDDAAANTLGRRLRQRFTIAANGVALVLLLTAIGLGVWSRTGATRVRRPDLGDSYAPYVMSQAQVGFVAAIAVLAALVVTTALIAGWRRPDEDGNRHAGTMVLAGFILFFMLISTWAQHIPSRYGQVLANFVMAQDVPCAVAAWFLTLAGCLAAMIASSVRPDPKRESRRGTVLVGVAVGVLVASLVVVVTVRAGDADAGVDATTAAEVPIPGVPNTLGAKRFSVALPSGGKRATDLPQRPPVVVGGAGYLVGAATGVRAFDSSGRERWHYLRRTDGEFTGDGVYVFDHGRTVLVPFGSATTGGKSLAGHVVALDAITGAELWTSDDPVIRQSLGGDFFDRGRMPYLMRHDGGDRWTRIDTRTGDPMWSLDEPTECIRKAAAAGDRIALITQCLSGDEVTYRLRAIDAASGRVLLDKDVYRYSVAGIGADFLRRMSFRVAPANDNSVAILDGTTWSIPEEARDWRVIDVATGATVPIDDDLMSYTGVPGDDALTVGFASMKFIIQLRSGPLLQVRCRIDSSISTDDPVIWLGDQVVAQTDGRLAPFSRRDCAPAPPVKEPGELLAAHAAPGVVLVVREEGDRVLLDGYS